MVDEDDEQQQQVETIEAKRRPVFTAHFPGPRPEPIFIRWGYARSAMPSCYLCGCLCVWGWGRDGGGDAVE